MSKKIKESGDLEYFITNYDFYKLLDTPKIIKYADLEYFNFNQLLPKNKSYLIVLLESELNKGHWVCLLRYNNTIEYFDSYGEDPFYQLKKIPIKTRRELDLEYYDMEKLIQGIPKKYKIIYNSFPLQEYKKDINTCGKWIYLRIKFLLENNFDLYQFLGFITNFKKNYSNLSYDEILNSYLF